jgi:mannose-6-phosphate isomerase class I
VERGLDDRPPPALADLSYDANPRYPVVGGAVENGFDRLAADIARERPRVLALDGPAALPWDTLTTSLVAALAGHAVEVQLDDARRSFVPWEDVERRTSATVLSGDPVFARIFAGDLADLVDGQRRERRTRSGTTVVFGPGSAFLPHDRLWYADIPKRLSLERIQNGLAGNIGQPSGQAGSEQRLLFVDWPLLDRHKQALLPRIDRYLDLGDPETPRSLAGDALRASLRALAEGPFRVRPTFLPGPWGGQWLRRRLGIATDAPNLAWSYELITPESGLLLGGDDAVEVGFELLMAGEGARILGPELAERFGTSFPIRFDYLDTLEGGHLSIQCHPSEEYARDVFGLPYTQHETYYVVDTTPGAKVFLGLREDADVEAFRRAAERAELLGIAFDPERFLQAHPAEQHRLYLIPAGTPHASGAGNLVLEISATPYLYTLRFYDWLRRDLDGELRPVHLAHAFANLDPARRGEPVRRDLIQEPVVKAAGPGFTELRLGELDELFFAVDRLDFENEVAVETRGRFHVLNLVAGEEVAVETARGDSHSLAYAETLVIPASVSGYRLERRRGPACKVVRALVK